MLSEAIRNELERLKDPAYRAFQMPLLPDLPEETFIGVRTPDLRRLAKKYACAEGIGEFLTDLPHRFFDENQLHAFLIAETKDFSLCLERTEAFLPYVDNWATCDQLSPPVFRRRRHDLLPAVLKFLRSDRPYTVRFGIRLLMDLFLDEDFRPEYPDLVASVTSDHYYVRMMIAWYFATALAKQYDAVLPVLTERRLDPRVHNKTIQKAVESRRIDEAHKDLLRTLRIPLRAK